MERPLLGHAHKLISTNHQRPIGCFLSVSSRSIITPPRGVSSAFYCRRPVTLTDLKALFLLLLLLFWENEQRLMSSSHSERLHSAGGFKHDEELQ